MTRTIAIYSLVIAGAAFLLQGLEYLHLVRMFSTEIYVVLIAALFTGFGTWLGVQLTKKRPAEPFQRNDKAMKYLGITQREYEVLEQLATGHSNKEIAEQLFVSPHTVKSHLKRLYDKLEASSRVQAIKKAKELRLIP